MLGIGKEGGGSEAFVQKHERGQQAHTAELSELSGMPLHALPGSYLVSGRDFGRNGARRSLPSCMGAVCSSDRQYKTTMRGVRARLLARSGGDGLLYVAELHDGVALPKMDHLVCFLPGLLALGHLHGVNTGAHRRP